MMLLQPFASVKVSMTFSMSDSSEYVKLLLISFHRMTGEQGLAYTHQALMLQRTVINIAVTKASAVIADVMLREQWRFAVT